MLTGSGAYYFFVRPIERRVVAEPVFIGDSGGALAGANVPVGGHYFLRSGIRNDGHFHKFGKFAADVRLREVKVFANILQSNRVVKFFAYVVY